MGQLAVIASSPVLTRIYGPGDFGVLAVYAALVALFAPLIALNYDLAIPLPESEREAFATMVLSGCAVIAVSTAVALATWLDALDIVVAEYGGFRPYDWIVPFGLVAFGFYRVLSLWAVRQKAFGVLARTSAAQGIGQVIVQIAMGLTIAGPVGLIVGQLVGRTAGITSLLRRAIADVRALGGRVVARDVVAAAARYRRFPLFTSPGSICYAISAALPPLVMSGLYGPATAGWFLLSDRMLGAPTYLVASSVSQVFFGRAAEMRRNGERLDRLFGKVTRIIALWGLPLLGVALVGPDLFEFVFGRDWREAGVYVRLLTLMYFARVFAASLSSTYTVLERQDLQLVKEVVRASLLVGGVAAGWAMGVADSTMVGIIAVTGAAGYTIELMLLRGALRADARRAA